MVRVGQRDIVVAVGDARLIGIDPASGEVLFDQPHGGDPVWIASNSAVPMPAGNGRLFVKTHVDNSTMYRLVVDADGRISAKTLWTAPVLRQTYGVPVYHDGHLYGMNGRTVFTCVDAETGEMRWRTREPGDGWPTLVGDQIVFVTKAQTLHVGPASPQGWTGAGSPRSCSPTCRGAAPSVPRAIRCSARSLGELARVDWKGEPAPAATAAARPPIASPTLARFLDEVERAPDKTAAVDRFLSRAGNGPLARSTRPRGVPLPRARGRTSGSAGDLGLGIRREDPMIRAPGTDLFYFPRPGSARLARQLQLHPGLRETGTGSARTPRARAARGSGRGRPLRWRCRAGSSPPPSHVEPPEGRRGRMETVEFASTLRPGAKATLHVYLPAGHERADDRYPVAYVARRRRRRTQGLVPRSLDNLMPERVAPALVVFQGRMGLGERGSRPRRRSWTHPSRSLEKEIVPLIDARFRTIAEPGARAVVGQAIGAITAIAAAFDEPGLFGALGVQSAFLLDVIENAPQAQIRTSSERPLRVYHDWGLYGHASTREARDLRVANRRFNEYLRSKGYQPAGGEAKDGDGLGELAQPDGPGLLRAVPAGGEGASVKAPSPPESRMTAIAISGASSRRAHHLFCRRFSTPKPTHRLFRRLPLGLLPRCHQSRARPAC